MKLNNPNNLILVLILLIFGCQKSRDNNFPTSFYKTEDQWISTITSLGYKKKKLRNYILLVTRTTACIPCLQEIAWWNRYNESKKSTKIILIVIEKYKNAFDEFLKTKDIHISAFRDSAGRLKKNDLIPTTPIKIYFNKKGKISLVYNLGTNGKIGEFLDKIAQLKRE